MIEWIKAWWRGERRVSSGRGRVYEKRGVGAARSSPKPVLRARVFRAGTGKWEDVG